jgi:glutathione S-transferase
LWCSTAACDLLAQLKILDGHLAGRDWFALDRFTIADIALGSIVKRCLEFPIERPACSELTRWQAAIDARPAFTVAVGAKASVLTPTA